MRRLFISLFLLSAFAMPLSAQILTKSIMKENIPVTMFQATYALRLPALDAAKDYKIGSTIGGGIVHKTENNWLFTLNGNYIFGGRSRGDRFAVFGEGITTTDGEIIGGAGSVASFLVDQRGVHFQAEAGKLLPFGPNPNCGVFVQAGLGYHLTRFRIDFQQEMYNTPFVVYGDYEYGYDRMRGGPAGHLEAGYLFLSDTRLLNFSVSLEVTYALSKDLREYDFRVFTNPETGQMEPVGYTDPHKRYNDLYYGIRVSWNIPTYQRQPAEFYYN